MPSAQVQKSQKPKPKQSKTKQDNKITNSDAGSKKSDERSEWWLAFGVVLLLTLGTRYYQVTEPDHVCWDETHFGKMGSWYINRTFFFDVHPPLGKMLIALSGYLTGYNGTYPFEKPGDKYNGTSYEGMRLFCTTLGALITPMAFDTVYDMTRSAEAALVSAAYLLFDVGLITLNQYILLDPILLFFMVASVWGMVKVSCATKAGASYTARWWLWLLFTGTMLSCTTSVKFVGLFVVVLVGLNTVNELWIILGDLRKPIWETIKQIVCRALTLILWPILLYMCFFYVHLAVLNRSGNGDGFYSSAFQSRLIGNSLYNATMPRHVAYGAVVTIKNHKTGGGYLHSHYHLYPKGIGARQQQITTYTHKDENNRWIIKPYNTDSIAPVPLPATASPAAGKTGASASTAAPSPKPSDVRLLQHGEYVRLVHLNTGRNLHSHLEAAPMTKKHLQVTGYGEGGVGDANDIWRVLVVGGRPNETVKTVTTRLMFVHLLQNCALSASGKQLPKWGFEQQEVSCNQNLRDKHSYWNVEDNQHAALPSVNFSVYAPGFLARFIESHAVMFQGNAGLKPKEGEVTSRPWQWPINYRGQFFSGSSHRIYLLGNPIIWWSNLIFLALFLIVFFIMAVKQRRQAGRRRLQQHRQRQRGQSAVAPQQQQLPQKQKQSASGVAAPTMFADATDVNDWGRGEVAVAGTAAGERSPLVPLETDAPNCPDGNSSSSSSSGSSGSSNNNNNGSNKSNTTGAAGGAAAAVLDLAGDSKNGQRHQQHSAQQQQQQQQQQEELVELEGLSQDARELSLQAGTWLFVGWLLHYLPFWAMGRVLYFHHYFPALIFNSMLTGVMFNFLTGQLPRWLQQGLLGALLSILVWSFAQFAPLAYGMSGPLANESNSTMHGLKWLSSWEF